MYKLGDKVIVSDKNSWAQGVTGTISMPNDYVKALVSDEAPWDGYHRFVKGKEKMLEFYWILFDNPQMDADRDGPYIGAEIEASMISPI